VDNHLGKHGRKEEMEDKYDGLSKNHFVISWMESRNRTRRPDEGKKPYSYLNGV